MSCAFRVLVPDIQQIISAAKKNTDFFNAFSFIIRSNILFLFGKKQILQEKKAL
jgi:hypothetical protein